MAPSGVQRRMTARQIFLKDLNPLLTCTLCRGYLIDATSLVDCFHIFCRACILRYFDNFKLACPTCGVICKKKSNSYRSDPVIQSLVYKLVPGLYSKEVQRREDFYRSTGVRASSSCSEDSVLGDLNDEHEEWVSSTCGDQNQYLSPEDAISLSLEYYNPHLDTGQNSPSPNTSSSTNYEDSTKPSDVINSANLSAEKTYNCDSNNSNVSGGDANNDNDNDDKTSENSNNNKHGLQSNIFDELSDTHKGDRRYLQCPAAVSMTLLHKFLRMKYALSPEHRVDIIYSGEILPQHFTLMDVAYTFQWRRVKPMRFFYRIFIPAKIQPIKIISTPSSDGKQLQVVLAKSTSSPQTIQNDSTKDDCVKLDTEAENYINKERLMTNLQLQCKIKSDAMKEEESNCVFEYEEPDKDEIREFAEKRDREWALQKKLDEEKEKHRNGKKRKKNKHSKNNVLYKKRKLHAEITSSESLQKEESLKLKVKLTPHNGYKHKHHKSSQSNLVVDAPKPPEMSSKEKLLQMRQVRHKHIPSEDRMKNTAHVAPVQEEAKLPILPENPQRNEEVPIQNVEKSASSESSGKTLRSDFSVKTKEIFMQKYPTVQIERNEQTEKHAQKTFLKTFQSYTEKLPQQDKSSSPKSRSPANTAKTQAQPQLTKSLEEKIANLHQQCTTIEPKPITLPEPPKLEKKYFTSEKSSTYSTGFTVSKVEVGVKRNPDNENSVQDKRPSLEITLINPPLSPEKPKPTPIAKRPPPPTIPLERIKKSMNRISGLSIIPKLPEKCDNTGALDLSKPNRNADLPKPCDLPNKILNGFNHSVKSPERGELSNLQMLSKVATEHPNINKNALVLNKRLPIPNLQTLKIPSPQNSTPKSNLAKLPKLNEISKTQFRLTNPQMRNMRPNQNQSIRNIPNPSLLVRQQNQNRLNSLNTTQNQTETKEPIKVVTTNGESEKSDCRAESNS